MTADTQNTSFNTRTFGRRYRPGIAAAGPQGSYKKLQTTMEKTAKQFVQLNKDLRSLRAQKEQKDKKEKENAKPVEKGDAEEGKGTVADVSSVVDSPIEGFMVRAMTQFQQTISEPQLLVLLVVLFFAAYTHHCDAEKSIVSKIVKTLKQHETFKQLGGWIEDNVTKFFGVALSIAMCTVISKKHMYTAMVASSIAIVMLPAASVTFYAITSASVMLYTRMKIKSDKLILACILVFVYVYYTLDVTVDPDDSRGNKTSHK